MKIIILGAGKVGKTLIKHMSNEDHDIIVVDQNATKVEEVVNQYDVIGVVGNGGSYDILMEAGAEDANLIICVTASDELNILAGLMAKKMGTRHTIARVRNPDYSSQRDFMRNQLVFSMIVNPKLEAASEIRRVLSFPSAVKVDTFSRGKVELSHNEDAIIPDGNYAIKPSNHLYITGTHRDLSRFCLDIGVITNRIKNVIIVVGIKTCFIF